MLSIKSFKNIQVLRTQKMIREQMQKEDFFDNLITKITQQFTPSQYQYLINYVIPKKNEPRNQKRLPFQANKYVTFESKENNLVFNATYSETQKIQHEKSFKDMRSEDSYKFQRQMNHFFTETIKNVKRNPNIKQTIYSSQSKKVTNSLSNKKTITRKFKQISIAQRRTETLDRSCNYKLSKQAKKALQQDLLTRQNIKRAYNQKFLKSIMKTEIFQDDCQKIDSIDFNEKVNLRKTHIPTIDFWQKQKEKEETYRNFSSIKFSGSPKTARLGLRIFTRKF